MPKKSSFLACLVALSLAGVQPCLSVDGFAVSVAWRNGQLNWGAAPKAPESGDFRGALVRYEISNNVPTADTIIKRTTCIVHGGAVAINLEGTKIAFFRWKNYLDNTGALKSTGQSYVSVVNRNGDSLRNLAAINDPSDADNSAMDWPAGPWIYYVKPKAGANVWDRRSRTIYRVNVNTSQNDSITTVVENSDSGSGWWIRRFSLTIDGSKMCLQNGQVAGSHLSCFPPPANGQYRSAPCNVFEFGACNGSVCAGGQYTLSYKGWHNDICFSTMLSSLPGPASVRTQTDLVNWGGGADVCPPQPSGNPPNCNDCGGEWMHWSVNSDKWSSHWLGACQHAGGMLFGTNAVLLNWIDRQSILLTHYKVVFDPSPGGSGVISYGECGGDFWIDGGAANAGKWEGVDGVWKKVNATGIDRANSINPRLPDSRVLSMKNGFCVELPGHICSVTLTDMRGKIVFNAAASGAALVPRDRLAPGAYLLSVQDRGIVRNQKLTME